MKKLYAISARMLKGPLSWFAFSCAVLVAFLAGCDFHGPWEYYPEERDVYTGIYTYGYIISGESPHICFSKVYELDESSSRNFAFYDSARVTVKGRFLKGVDKSSKKDTTLVLSRTSENPNCFTATGSYYGKVGEQYEMKAYFEWDSAGHSAESEYKAVATIPNAVKVKGLNVPKQDKSYGWMPYDEKSPVFEIEFLEYPADMEFVKCALDYDHSVRGVLAVLNYGIDNAESQKTTINQMFKGFTEEDSMGYRGIAIHDPLEKSQILGFTSNRRVADYNALDTAYLMNMNLPLGSISVDLYSTDAAYIDYIDKVKESVNDSRILPESNIENGMGVFTGMAKTTVQLFVKGSGVYFDHIAWRNCENTEGDNSDSWDSRGCRLYQDIACSGMRLEDMTDMFEDLESLNRKAYEYYRNADSIWNRDVKTCYASNVKAAMMLDTTKWSIFLPENITAKEKNEAYADGLKRYCVASNFENNKIADCYDLYQQCMVSTERNSCKEYLWNWCADRGWPEYDQCKSALVSRYYLMNQKSSILHREVEEICSEFRLGDNEKLADGKVKVKLEFKTSICKNWCELDSSKERAECK